MQRFAAAPAAVGPPNRSIRPSLGRWSNLPVQSESSSSIMLCTVASGRHPYRRARRTSGICSAAKLERADNASLSRSSFPALAPKLQCLGSAVGSSETNESCRRHRLAGAPRMKVSSPFCARSAHTPATVSPKTSEIYSRLYTVLAELRANASKAGRGTAIGDSRRSVRQLSTAGQKNLRGAWPKPRENEP